MSLTKANNRMIDGSIVNIVDFGAIGDGATDNASAIQLALDTGKSIKIPEGDFVISSSINYKADNQKILGVGSISQGASSAYIVCNGYDNCSIEGVTINGGSAAVGLNITGSASNFKVVNCYFYQGQQRVLLNGCDHVTVDGCTFDSIGYGVISQGGTSNNNVLVTSCLAKNVGNDFVISNSYTVFEKNWVVTNNIYSGNSNYPTAATERRFASFTECSNVVIDGNVIEEAAGDAAIHLEDLYGETIVSNNVFDNCLVSGGNLGYIYLLNSQEQTIISGNIFRRTDAALSLAYAIDVSSASFTNDVQITGNRFVGAGSSGNLSGLKWNFQSGQTLVSDNVFTGLVDAVNWTAASNVSFVSNKIKGCNSGIFMGSANGGNNWLISNNTFQGTVGTYDIFAEHNTTSGTNAPQKWTLIGNVFEKSVLVRGQSGASAEASGDALDVAIFNNVFRSTASLTNSGTMSRLARFGNIFQDTAVNETPRIEGLPNYANDTAAAAGNIPIGGIYRNGSIIQVRVT